MPTTPDEPPNFVDDRVDLEAAARGDAAAFDALYRRHVTIVYRHAYSLLGTRREAEEIAQDVFVTLWGKISTVRIVDRSLLPWLLTTSRYLCLNRRRTLARNNARSHMDGLAALPPDSMSVEDRVRHRALREAIEDALAALSDEDYTVYLLCIEEGLSYQQASLSMGVSHGAVRNRLARLRAGLRIALGSARDQQ
ncbi:MAG TPA: sigma-70 family RNA polymerase sigma factor [Pseudolysinimonas sp.]|nr:sigma-70 family RNA polymerase sigma factor [Pseudolysinimonas sp.]